jgi:hypothetical protein
MLRMLSSSCNRKQYSWHYIYKGVPKSNTSVLFLRNKSTKCELNWTNSVWLSHIFFLWSFILLPVEVCKLQPWTLHTVWTWYQCTTTELPTAENTPLSNIHYQKKIVHGEWLYRHQYCLELYEWIRDRPRPALALWTSMIYWPFDIRLHVHSANLTHASVNNKQHSKRS